MVYMPIWHIGVLHLSLCSVGQYTVASPNMVEETRKDENRRFNNLKSNPMSVAYIELMKNKIMMVS